MTAAVIFIEIGVIITLIVSLMSCVCWRNKHKKPYSDDNPENKPQENHNNNKKLPISNSNHENRAIGEPDHLDPLKMRNPARELPDIPHNTDGQSSLHDSASDLNYETVTNASRTNSAAPGIRHSGDLATTSTVFEVKVHVQEAPPNEKGISVGQYDDSNVYATAQPSPLRRSPNLTESPPPVPEKRFEQGESSNMAAVPSNTRPTSAASAVAGNADIPFMTSPIRADQEYPNHNQHDTELLYDGNTPNPFYTSISVREPLANIKAQTKRQRYDSEPTYSFVSDDSDQMYAEIQLEQRPAIPPAPPTVESLRNVAQAQHSRQASASSFASDATSPHSPTSERNSIPSIRGTTAVTVEDLNDMYSTVNKPKKTKQTEENPIASPAIEDMYAKVQKGGATSTGARPKQPSNGHDSSHIQSVFGPNLHCVTKDNEHLKSTKVNSLVRRSSSKDDPNYEKIPDSPVWPKNPGQLLDHLRDHEPISQRPNANRSSRTFGSREDSDQNDPGYETVPVSKQFADYETIGGGYNSDDENEPGYEKVTNAAPYQRPDPNYESVDYDTVNGASKAAAGENPYWQIRPPGEMNDPVYEKISSQDDDLTDPNYEKVKTASELSYGESSEPGYEQVKQSGLSQNMYEKVRECDELLRRSEQSDSGYEKIHDNRVELHVEWNGDTPTPSDGGSDAPFFPSVAHPDDIELNPLPSPVDNIGGLSFTVTDDRLNGLSIYNMAFENVNRRPHGSLTSFEANKNPAWDSKSNAQIYSQRHDSLL